MVPLLVIVLGDDRIEIVVGHVAAGGDAESVFAPRVLAGGEALGGVVAAATEDDFSVEAFAEVVGGVGFDDSSHLRPYSAGKSAVKMESELMSSASISGPKLGERLSWRGMPSMTIGFDIRSRAGEERRCLRRSSRAGS